MEFGWADEDATFRKELRTFVADELNGSWEGPVRHLGSPENIEHAVRFNGKLAERGWFTPHWPVEYGGRAATPWQHIIMGEELWGVGEPRGPQYMNVNWIGPSIMAHGTPEQKAHHLPLIAAGKVVWCQGFSEPDAGSDLAALRTRADRDGDEYVVNGHKVWTSYASVADYCYLLVRTNQKAERHLGISVLLVPTDTPGLTINEVGSMVGEHAFHELFFDDMRVPVSCRLGAEDEGWGVVREALSYERVGAPRYARAAFQLNAAMNWAIEHDVELSDAVIERAGQAAASCEAARLLAYKVIDERCKGLPPGPSGNVARAAMVQAERLVGQSVLELQGTEAMRSGVIADEQFRKSLAAGIAAGSYETQLNLIARLRLDLPKGYVRFDLSDQQSEVLASVRTLLARHAGPERAQALGGDAPAYDTALEDALEASGFGAIGADPDAGPLEAALVTEEVARSLGVVASAARSLVAVGVGAADLPRPIAVVTARQRGPVRFAADAATLLVVDDDAARAVPLAPGTYAPVRSRFGYPFGDVDTIGGGDVLPNTSASRALAWWRLALAVEMVGTMGAALDLTVRYVTDRKQFGKSIGSFQVIQHRLAELTVLVDGARYLALEAAWNGAPEDGAAAALTHASVAAKRLPAELHQMSGAMGFATEYPLHLWTMRLPALGAEARGASAGPGRLGAERHLVALRWPGSVA